MAEQNGNERNGHGNGVMRSSTSMCASCGGPCRLLAAASMAVSLYVAQHWEPDWAHSGEDIRGAEQRALLATLSSGQELSLNDRYCSNFKNPMGGDWFAASPSGQQQCGESFRCFLCDGFKPGTDGKCMNMGEAEDAKFLAEEMCDCVHEVSQLTSESTKNQAVVKLAGDLEVEKPDLKVEQAHLKAVAAKVDTLFPGQGVCVSDGSNGFMFQATEKEAAAAAAVPKTDALCVSLQTQEAWNEASASGGPQCGESLRCFLGCPGFEKDTDGKCQGLDSLQLYEKEECECVEEVRTMGNGGRNRNDAIATLDHDLKAQGKDLQAAANKLDKGLKKCKASFGSGWAFGYGM